MLQLPRVTRHTHTPRLLSKNGNRHSPLSEAQGDLRVYRALLPMAASQALALTDSPSESRRQGGDQELRRK